MAKLDSRMLRIHELDFQYQNISHSIALLHQDENKRRLGVGIVRLQGEKAMLEAQASHQSTVIKTISSERELLLRDMQLATRDAEVKEAKAKQYAEDLARLQTELEKLNSAAAHTDKLDQEKLDLTRELDRIRPQLEQLQSQTASNKTLTAKKGELERRVNTLEVEVENEKRSKLKLQQKHDSQLEELRHKLKQEKALRASETKVTHQTQTEKLKPPTKSPQKKEKSKPKPQPRMPIQSSPHSEYPLLTDTEEAEATATPIQQSANASAQHEVVGECTEPEPRKKKNGSFETSLANFTMQTPGNTKPGPQHNSRMGALGRVPMVAKSTFSITPFLNKTKTIEDESSEAEPAKATPSSDASSDNDFPTPEIIKPRQRKGKPTKLKQSPKKALSVPDRKSRPAKLTTRTKALDDSPGYIANRTIPSPASREQSKTNHTERVKAISSIGGCQDKENTPLLESNMIPKQSHDTSAISADGIAENKKRKRKLLGGARKAIFDEDEADAEEATYTMEHSTAKKRFKAPKGALSNAFTASTATFSPLKRDRRGVNASFLGA